jgi:hypothetical protein
LKKGCGQKAAELLRDNIVLEKKLGGYDGPSRIYLRESNEVKQISLEQEYPSIEACKKDIGE